MSGGHFPPWGRIAHPLSMPTICVIIRQQGDRMKYNREKHHRRSVHMKGYDYSTPGAYFVTVCAWNRECIFGEIIDVEMKSNEYGNVIHREWMRAGDIRSNVELDEFIVMPNHFHGIMIINAGNICRGMARHVPTF